MNLLQLLILSLAAFPEDDDILFMSEEEYRRNQKST